ncbi:hypothetical protein [Enterococcus termitis]|uniref:Uncharacterized protein n=1 Tax=Enterococcus termitis TaxID=332950 RepID=A0A1E5GVS7_9ENTE|nr:hypothetical protein [Enterococcus termitis]OEG16803.1 hypothetical protein BCR25_04190 [Enterococcus termitis]OJG99514.1 hypothetical protein RV18_GL001582 [Enterococcus termitis]
MNEQKLSQIMVKMGFLALENNGVEIYMLETRYYYLVIEPTTRNNRTTYDFIKYSYNKSKGETKIIKCYFEGFNENAMVKKVGSYMAFVLERGYLKTNNKQILPFAREISKRKIFI